MSFSHPQRRRRATTCAAAVVVAALVAAGASGGATPDSAAGLSATSTAGVSATVASAHISAVRYGTGATAAELAAARASVARWSTQRSVASIPAVAALSKKIKLKGKTVFLVPLSDGIPAIHMQIVGIQQALAAAGATATVCDGGVGDIANPTAWANCLTAAKENKADAVISLMIDYQAVHKQFDALAKAGIPTLIGGVRAKGLTAKRGRIAVFNNVMQQVSVQRQVATTAVALGGANTNLLQLRLLDSIGTTASSDAGVRAARAACAACSITTADFTTADAQEQLANLVSAALVKNPQINMVIVPDVFTPLVMQGIMQAGKVGRVQILTSDGSLQALLRIRAGTLNGTVLSPEVLSGWGYVNALAELMAGDPVGKGARLPSRVITQSNVNSLPLTAAASTTDRWVFGKAAVKASYTRPFLAAWKLK